MSKSEILVTTSTGNVGQYLSRALHEKQVEFTAATRDEKAAEKKLGFLPETVVLDFREPEAFQKALQGRKILFLCGPSATPGAEKLLEPLVSEAIDAGIRHVVFIASYPDIMERIENSSMDYTFLRGNFFMQNFEMYQTEDIRDRNQLFMPTGKGKAPFIHTRDIGQVAAKVIENPGEYRGKTLYLTGPESIDHYAVAEVFSRVLGRKITYLEPDDEAYRKEMKKRGFPDSYIDAMIAVFGKIKKGKVDRLSDTVEQMLGRKPTALEDYVKETRDIFS